MNVTLVLGASGLLGNAIYHSRLGELTNTKVIGLSRQQHENYMYCSYDQSFIGEIKKNNWQVKFIIVTAGFPSVYMSQKNPVADNTNNFKPILFCLELARAVNAQLIYISSIEVYGGKDNSLRTEASLPQPQNFYGLNKFYAEQYILFYSRFFNLHYLILRPSIFLGNNMRKNIIYEHKKALKTNKRVDIYCLPTSILNFIHVADVVDAIIFLIQKNICNDIFNLGSDKDFMVSDFTNWVEENYQCQLYVNQLDIEYQYKTAPCYKIKSLGWQAPKTIFERLQSFFNAVDQIAVL